MTREFPFPKGWVKERRWAPRRYFGPIFGNSPDLHLNGENATFVYNNFFVSNPDAAIFRQYYGANLPSNAPTLPEAIPGQMPSTGFKDVRLSLDRLTYSSRYGGTFKLSFVQSEDLEIEYREGNQAWDIASLEMSVYVVPVASQFNPVAGPIFSNSLMYVEFHPQGVVGYDVGQNGRLTIQTGDPLPGLLTALSQTAVTAASGANFPTDAIRFSLGFVHTQFSDLISGNRVVTGVEISDGYFFPRTREGIPVALVTAKVSDINLDTEWGSEEIHVSLTVAHVYDGLDQNNWPAFRFEFPEIDDHGSTPEKVIGAFPLENSCGNISEIWIFPDVMESDPISDDVFGTDPTVWSITVPSGTFPCSAVQAAFNNNQYGLVSELPSKVFTLLQGGDVQGAMTMRTRIYLVRE
jgi:hypothetical protein